MTSSIAQTLPDTHPSRCSLTTIPSGAAEGVDNRGLDGVLVTQCLCGDAPAFERILEKHQARIHKYCYRVLRSSDRAEEATQEVFARALEKLHTLRRAELLGAWLKSIALNLCLSMIEKERAYAGEIHFPENVCSVDANPEQRLLASERRLFIAGLIAQLPHQQRTVFRMMYVDGYTYKEIQTTTGLSNQQVKSYLQNARRRIRQALSRTQLQRRPGRMNDPTRTLEPPEPTTHRVFPNLYAAFRAACTPAELRIRGTMECRIE
jgi:RNA polymerase sigma factor (sigma-70 family)